MKQILFLIGLCAGLLIGIGSAAAGPCAAEIQGLKSRLADAQARQAVPPQPSPPSAAETVAGTDAARLQRAAALTRASSALGQAEALDRSGDEAACMSEVAKAKGAIVLE